MRKKLTAGNILRREYC